MAEVDAICTHRLPRCVGGGICGRPLSDPCGICRLYDSRKDEWEKVFNQYQEIPRVAVEGDI